MVRTLKQRAGIEQGPASRHIYIGRNDTNARTVKNEAQLMSQMKDRGFEILTLSEMSVRDQMLAFSNARIVIGPHGAGMANILYSSDQTILVELLQSTYANNCMMRLAQNIGARHVAKFFFPDARGEPYPWAWHIDLHQTDALLDKIMA